MKKIGIWARGIIVLWTLLQSFVSIHIIATLPQSCMVPRSVDAPDDIFWNACDHTTHIGLNFDYSLAQFMLQVLKPSSTLELGCGLGLYTDWMHRSGQVSTAYCIEPGGSDSIIFSHSSSNGTNTATGAPELIQLHILDGSEASATCAEDLDRFDLVYSIGVADNMPPEIHARMVDFLTKKTRGFLVFSAVGPTNGRVRSGASTTTSATSKSRDDWKEEFESRGMLHLKKTSADLQAISYNKSHRRGNIMVFAGLHAPMGHALDSEFTVNIDIDMSFYDLVAQKARGTPGARLHVQDQTVVWCSNLKSGELRTWPELVLQQAQCFGGSCS